MGQDRTNARLQATRWHLPVTISNAGLHLTSHLTSAVQVTPTDWLTSNREPATTELFEFLRIPSVSARSEHRADVARATRSC